MTDRRTRPPLLRRRVWIAGLLVLLVLLTVAAYFGGQMMNPQRTAAADLTRQLGPDAAELIGSDARLAAWVPDANYRPQGWYLLRPLDEAALHRLAARLQLPLSAAPAVPEAIWRLPAGLELPGWRAPTLPPGSATLQAQGTLGRCAVWLRWHDGQLFLVAQLSGP